MLINKESEKHIRNLARCLNIANKPFGKLGGVFTLSELLKTKDLPQWKKDSINYDVMKEVSMLLSELGINYEDYPGGYKNWETVTLYQLNLEKAKLEKQKGGDFKNGAGYTKNKKYVEKNQIPSL